MTSTITGPLATVDDDYDRAYASDGKSRYGAYLRQHTAMLHYDGEAVHLTSFAARCWHIATSPIMAPGYATLRSDFDTATVTCQNDQDGIVATVTVRVPWPYELRFADRLSGWQSWRPRTGHSTEPRFAEPVFPTMPALLHTAQLRVPIRLADLPPRSSLTPWRNRRGIKPGDVRVDDAKNVVRAICDAINTTAGPVLDLLRDGARP